MSFLWNLGTAKKPVSSRVISSQMLAPTSLLNITKTGRQRKTCKPAALSVHECGISPRRTIQQYVPAFYVVASQHSLTTATYISEGGYKR
jgi:hypothetical protein